MGNPNWIRGGKSPNPDGGRRKKNLNSYRTVKSMVERFVKRNISPQKLQKLYDQIAAKEKLQFLVEMLPYCEAKITKTQMGITYEKLNDRDLDQLYQSALDGIYQTLQIDQPGRISAPKNSLLDDRPNENSGQP